WALAGEPPAGGTVRAAVVVLAPGSSTPGPAGTLGVRSRGQAGRGYSFTVPTEQPVPGPLYLPAVRVACTPYQGKLRVAGTMEFRGPDDPLDPGRIRDRKSTRLNSSHVKI